MDERASILSESVVEGIDLGHMKNKTHGEFTHDVLVRALATAAIETNLPDQLAAYRAAVEAETRAGFKDVSDSIVERIYNELDPARDKVETGMKAGFRAAVSMPDERVARAGEVMMRLVQKHKLNARLNVNDQTDGIRDFIADVEANHMEALRLTGMEVLFEQLRQANQAVCDAMVERVEDNREKVTNEMVDAREQTDKAYRALIRGVNSFAYVQGAAPYADFISFVNSLIRLYKRMYFGQSSSSSGSASGEGSGSNEGENTPGDGDNTGEDNNTNNGNENTGGTTTPPGSVPTNPQPGDGDDPDLYIYEL